MYMKLFSTHLIENRAKYTLPVFGSILCKTGGEQPMKFEILCTVPQEIENSPFHHMTYIVYTV